MERMKRRLEGWKRKIEVVGELKIEDGCIDEIIE
jgi:hypothetical protein